MSSAELARLRGTTVVVYPMRSVAGNAPVFRGMLSNAAASLSRGQQYAVKVGGKCGLLTYTYKGEFVFEWLG